MKELKNIKIICKKLTGTKFSKEICEKISQNKIGKGLKPIICDTLLSLSEASEVLNLNKGYRF